MDRLTIKKKLPPKGIFTSFSKEDMDLIGESDEREIYQRLQEYENTGLSPDEISAMKADNERLHALIDVLECVITRKEGVK